MNYYVISPNVWNDNKFKELLTYMYEKHCVLMGWEDNRIKGAEFANMQVGDCVVVARRQKWKWNYYFMGLIQSTKITTYKEAQCRNLDFFINLEDCRIDFLSTWTRNTSKQIPAIAKISENNDIINFLKAKMEMKKNMERVDKCIKLLKMKKNIILQGVPGTGKTWNTAEIAVRLIDGENANLSNHKDVMKRYEELQKEGQIAFCTFHQSMDYEDFVEGLKPEIVEGGVNYKVEDGIFKEICERAKENIDTKTIVDNFEDSWRKIVDELGEKDFMDIPLLSGKKKFRIALNFFGDGFITLKRSENGEYEKSSSRFFNHDQCYNVYRGLPGVPKGGFDNYRKAIVACMKSNFGLKEYESGSALKEKKNYVLIIDEINRGNVSKIFGELITLLEADKRLDGDHPVSVTLPYSKNDFSVPSNLYIIGTMNTTDRSTGNIDYAVRRRFAFVTLESKEDLITNATAKSLFNAIKDFIEKHKTDMDISDLMPGHSYFMAKDENEFKLKFEYEIVPLLREYVKDGLLNVSEDEFKKIFKEQFKSLWTLDDAIKNIQATLKAEESSTATSDNDENQETE